MSRNTQAREKMSDISGVAAGRAQSVSGSMMVGRGMSRLSVIMQMGENGPVGIVGDGQVMGRCRLKLRTLLGERGPLLGDRVVRMVERLFDRPLEGGVTGLDTQKLLLRVLLPPEEPLVELLVSDTDCMLIFLSLLKALMLLTGGGVDFKVTGILVIDCSGAA